MSNYPATDVVILAGGQARRMSGVNKLLQTFEDKVQLVKIYQHVAHGVNKVWVNSHRDLTLYRRLIPNIGFFPDHDDGFLGPLMGMKTAWSYVESDHIVFIPCDVTYIPPNVVSILHEKLKQSASAQVVYIEVNYDPLYPFCVMKRESLAVLTQQLKLGQYSLKQCFKHLGAEKIVFKHEMSMFHSINSIDELQQYRQARDLS